MFQLGMIWVARTRCAIEERDGDVSAKTMVYVVKEGKRRRVKISLSKLLCGYCGENLYPMLQSISSSFGLGPGKRGHGLRWRGQNYFEQGFCNNRHLFPRISEERTRLAPWPVLPMQILGPPGEQRKLFPVQLGEPIYQYSRSLVTLPLRLVVYFLSFSLFL
jgi:hypothetical protein